MGAAGRGAWIAACGLLAGLYFAAARLGLALDPVSAFAALVWPASGIALAALTLGGRRLWPGVALGAFLANVVNGAHPLTAAGIAAGNTLAAAAGAALLGRAGFRPALDRLRDVAALVGLAALGSTLVAATTGAGCLWLSGALPAGAAGETWLAWWVGDALGDLVVAPLVFTWAAAMPDGTRGRGPGRVVAAVGVGAAIVAGAAGVFALPPSVASAPAAHGMVYAIFPLLMVAAVAFGPRGATSAAFLVSAVAVACTALRTGPFVRVELHEGLLQLQLFMGITTTTFAVLAAVTAERAAALATLERAHGALAVVNSELERAVDVRDAVIAMASHELRTPLHSLKLQLGLLRLRASTTDDPPDGRVLGVLERQVRRLVELVTGLLDASRMPDGRLTIDVRDGVDLVELARDVAQRLGQDVPGGGRITVRAPQPVVGRWDRARLDQVVTNLLTNAVQYGAGLPIEVVVEAAGDQAKLTVRDHGVGIAQADQARVFERFERASPAGLESRGLGLGLWIVRQIAEAHGGAVSLESALGAGSTFTVVLPRSGPAGERAAA